ncbi:hypothetical protein COLO4_25517 [Corchorus olitorius]|uniref:Leucine-rich repeat-containing N-terminal plant-type domain-containing protein n=1 Tax=Corchorus olitorius TaxID=93759 RepID=A0A1R3I1Y0_9ROSI|nr:hypothetical protein COLO4_25517 [Corchorus olitorius]
MPPRRELSLLHFKTTLSLDFSYYPGFACDSTSPPKTNSWNETTNCCLWEGVTCDKVTAHVVALDLSCSWLIGSLPPPKKPLFLPPRLQRLNFARNNLDGSISSAATLLSQLSLTHLDLSYNYFSGPISTSFLSQFVSLTYLDLSFNQFSGSIPSEISLLSNLVSLDLASNDELTLDEHSFDLLARNLSKLTNLNFGDIDMSCVPPPSLLNLTSTLKHLSLSSCELDGELPSEVFRFPYLQYLDLSWNQNLTGYLPKSNNWTSPLKHLDLAYCNFEGEIPASLGNLTQITFLALEGVLPSHSGLQNLDGLHLSDNLISGEVPSWLFALPSFRILDLSNNKLLSLPTDDQIQNPSSLKEIYLRSNHIHGSIPSFLFHHLVNLTQLDLSSNNLSGVITSDMLAKAKSLHTLDLSSNSQLSLTNSHIHHDNYTFNELYNVTLSSCNITRFPSFLQTAKKLRYLDLSNNKIEGSISKWDSEGWEQLTELYLSHNSLTSVEQYWPGQKLQTLDVSSNQLHGEIPTSFCNMSSLQSLDLSVNNLGGIIPSCLATSPPFRELRLQLNNFHGQIPAFESGALRTLALNDNQLEGLLPRSLDLIDFMVPFENVIAPSSFPRLEIIDLSQNVFTGTLPPNLLNLTSMKYERGPCKFDSDESEGCTFLLPDQNYVEIVMKKLQLKMNVGPDVMGFTIIDFSDNQFYGGIPEVLGELGALLVLNLSHNHFHPTNTGAYGST